MQRPIGTLTLLALLLPAAFPAAGQTGSPAQDPGKTPSTPGAPAQKAGAGTESEKEEYARESALRQKWLQAKRDLADANAKLLADPEDLILRQKIEGLERRVQESKTALLDSIRARQRRWIEKMNAESKRSLEEQAALEKKRRAETPHSPNLTPVLRTLFCTPEDLAKTKAIYPFLLPGTVLQLRLLQPLLSRSAPTPGKAPE
jgi:hypothetical protein